MSELLSGNQRFFQVGDSSRNVYKDENDFCFAGENLSEHSYEQWQDDLDILRKIGSHQNIVRIFICCSVENTSVQKLIILTELCDANLEDKITAKQVGEKRIFFKPPCSDNLPFHLDLLHQTAHGLKYLHDKRIIHCNIHPSNVLLTLTSQNQTVAKLGGFRYSKQLPDQKEVFISWLETTATFMARECHEKLWSRESDIFALGILMYYTLTNGEHPFDFLSSPTRKINTIKETIINEEDARINEDHLTSETDEEKYTQSTMIRQMLNHNPEERLKIEEVLYHPTFYTAERKLEFFLKIRESLRKVWELEESSLKKKIEASIQGYWKNLAPEEMYRDYPYFITSYSKKNRKRLCGDSASEDDTVNLSNFLTTLRNKVVHACDDNRRNNKQFKTDFEVTFDSYSAAKFVGFVAKQYPKLLVDLYNTYKAYNSSERSYEKRLATKFFP